MRGALFCEKVYRQAAHGVQVHSLTSQSKRTSSIHLFHSSYSCLDSSGGETSDVMMVLDEKSIGATAFCNGADESSFVSVLSSVLSEEACNGLAHVVLPWLSSES